MQTCHKISFTLRAAKRALIKIWASNNPTRQEIAVYPCQQCHAFHLTSDKTSASNKWTRDLQTRQA